VACEEERRDLCARSVTLCDVMQVKDPRASTSSSLSRWFALSAAFARTRSERRSRATSDFSPILSTAQHRHNRGELGTHACAVLISVRSILPMRSISLRDRRMLRLRGVGTKRRTGSMTWSAAKMEKPRFLSISRKARLSSDGSSGGRESEAKS
jgi:hypothetical protein